MEELNHLQKKLLKRLAHSPLKQRFYWTGGTALSFLYLHHRQSKDIDLFSDSPFSFEDINGFVNQLRKDLKLPKVELKKIYDRYEFFLHNKEKVRLEFVFYEHPQLKPRQKWQGIFVDSLDDIATNKTMAFFDRNDPKDLFDIYFLLQKNNYKVKKLLKMVEKKFGISFSESSFWSEAYKSIKLLSELQPFLLEQDKQKQKKLLKDIESYFKNNSTAWLCNALVE